MSNVLQTRETDIIVPAIRELQAQGIVVESYQYDGFQCPKEHLQALEAWIAERNARPGRVRFAIKPSALLYFVILPLRSSMTAPNGRYSARCGSRLRMLSRSWLPKGMISIFCSLSCDYS